VHKHVSLSSGRRRAQLFSTSHQSAHVQATVPRETYPVPWRILGKSQATISKKLSKATVI
jgi:hypothetical protein